MGDQDDAGGEGNEVSKSASPKNLSASTCRSAARNAPGGSSPPSSPAIVVNSKLSPAPQEQNLPLPSAGRAVWGILTAISDKAKSRPQGSQILLCENEHVLGRSVKEPSYQFDSINVSARHCIIFRKRCKADEKYVPDRGAEAVSADRWLVFIKDSSSNGTFINCQKLKRDSPAARIKDGDILSLVNAPEHENSLAYLYEEVKLNGAMHHLNGPAVGALKRKAVHEGDSPREINPGESKRSKGLGIGGPDGPVSLDDVRRLQRSNEDLRNQLEAHLLTIEKLRAESRAATARHDVEIKELRETVSAAFLKQIQDLRSELETKEKELESSASLCAQQQSQLEDRNRSLAAAIQSRKDADEVIKSQRLNIDEMKEQLEDERCQRRSERDKAENDLRSAVERVRSEAAEELRRHSDCAAQQLKEHLETISKLQEMDNENRLLIEALRSKLDDARETLVKAEGMIRSLELRLQDEECCSASARKKIAEKEQELQHSTKLLEEEKAAKDRALSRLSAMEIQMEAATRDLQMEQQRLQGARERLVLRETQLRAFHSTAEEIAMLQQKQQEQLKEMMRVLEDGEEESHMRTRHGSVRGRLDEIMLRGETVYAGHVTRESLDNETVNDEEQNEDAADADSQVMENNTVVQNLTTLDGGDTQMDEDNGLENASRNAQLVFVVDEEHKGSGPSAPVGVDAAGHTQMIETENLEVQQNNYTQELDYVAVEGTHVKAFAMHTQLVDTQSKSFSGRYLNETQLINNGRECVLEEDHHEVSGNVGVQIAEQENGVQGKPIVLEDEDVAKRDSGMKTVCESPLKENTSIAHDGNGQIGHPPLASSPEHLQANVAKGRVCPTTTGELMTSEAAGSWAYSTPASVHCDNGGWSQSQARGEAPQNQGQHDLPVSQVGGQRSISMQNGRMANSRGSLNAWHQKDRRDLNVMLGIVAPELSRLHGLDRVMETAPDSEDHTEEEEDLEDGHESDDDSGGNSEPMSQSVSVSAGY